MTDLYNPELAKVLQAARLSFCWNQVTRTWQLERLVNENIYYDSVMYVAQNQVEAEKDAVAFIKEYRMPRHSLTS